MENSYIPLHNSGKKESNRVKIVRRFLSPFFSLSPRSNKGWVKYNTYMEYLVELPNGQRVWMSKKEIDKLKEEENEKH